MKRNILFLLSICVLLFSCSDKDDPIKEVEKPPVETKDPFITLKKTNIDFTNEGGSEAILIESNVTWATKSSASWCTVSPSSGDKSTTTITLTAPSNEDYDNRSCTVTLEGGNITKIITVNQGENLGLLITQDRYELSNEESTIKVEVKANVEFDVEINDKWITKIEKRGLTTTELEFNIAENDTYGNREGSITIKQKGGGMTSTITIFQSQEDAIILSEKEFDLSSEAQSVEVEVKTNIDYEIIIPEDAKDWVSHSTTRALRTETVVLDIAQNKDYDERTAKIIVKDKKTDLEENVTFRQNGKEPFEPKGRTILVYLALDNSLSNEMVDVHASLMEGWKNSNKEGSLILFADSRGDEKPLLIQIKEHKGVVIADTLLMYDNENSASPELLSRVIANTKLIAPSDSYGMLLFSHATGWLPAKAFQNPAAWARTSTNNENPKLHSIFEDSGREMEFSDFVAAIPDGMFEFIASEMCFMSSVETAYALRNKTKYLLAAAPEVLSPGFEPIYKTSLDLLFKPRPDLEAFGQKFFDYFNGQQGAYQSAAISLVKTSEMQALANYTRKINLELTQEQVDKVQIYDRNGKPNVFFDFRDYVAQTATTKEMEQLDELLDKTVIFKRNTPKLINIKIAKHSGLSVYIPQDGLPRLNEAYENEAWYKATVN